MVHPEVQMVVDYPDTNGKKIAMDYFNWNKLDKTQECMIASALLKMAKKIDGE